MFMCDACVCHVFGVCDVHGSVVRSKEGGVCGKCMWCVCGV